MFIHVFLFSWRLDATDALKHRALEAIRAFSGVVPGLSSVAVGNNKSVNGNGFTFGGVMQFTDEAAYRAYAVHPAHLDLLAWLVPLIDAVEFDIDL